MYLRIDRLQIQLPAPKEPDPNAAAAVSELLGGRFGEMNTLMTYTYQSFNFRMHKNPAIKPFRDLVSNIATEELGHIELVSAVVNALYVGSTKPAPPDQAPLKPLKDVRNTYHAINTGLGAFPMDSHGTPWRGDYIFVSGNLVLDFLYNFFLEVGARLAKIRVYEMTDNPVAREMIGYLLVRGGVHAMAYGKALEALTGVEVWRMLPIPKIEDSKFPEAAKYMKMGVHRTLYRFSPSDYKDIEKIWKGAHPADGQPLQVHDGPPEGGEYLELPEVPEEFAPGLYKDDFERIAKRLGINL
ncbi:manganese catalase family protein [Pyrobaculum calidifontis]|uniref:Manganese containing catalase n=2 Tax=Pyrobaculum calidifontis TaxID=181486 RepID=A3MU38_PYRCJ|nr:manganese catalase family protein [Pyrobaculum calidifontis]ABO08155.1 manganese containing catalase [Pyrobaculum calidifontis JCM 11548]BAB97198.1 manganese catalase [Pyrobaculum calidifontis JCM 11548]